MAQILSMPQCVNCSCMVRLAGCSRKIVWGINLLYPERCGCDFQRVNFENMSIQIIITLEWMPVDFVDSKSTLVQVMAWYHQASSDYLNQCWLKISDAKWHHKVTMHLWPTFYTPYFQIHMLQWKSLNFDQNFIAVSPYESNKVQWQW